MKYGCYIASGWFSEDQERGRQTILTVCKALGLNFFSPKEEIICPPDASAEVQKNVFDGNLKAINNCDFVIVNTAGKDMGSIMESGYAYAKDKPIFFYCEGLKGFFNLMLSRSGRAVATNAEELEQHLRNYFIDKSYSCEYKGVIE